MRINSSIDKKVEVAVFQQNFSKEVILVPLFQFTSRIYYKLEKQNLAAKERLPEIRMMNILTTFTYLLINLRNRKTNGILSIRG